MKLSITHETHYRYTTDVEQAHHVAMLKPLPLAKQQVLWASIAISPLPETQNESLDALGQSRLYFEFSSAHRELLVTARSEVITWPLAPEQQGKLDQVVLPASAAWGDVAEILRYHPDAPFLDAREFALSSPLAPISGSFADYISALAHNHYQVLELARALTQKIHFEFKYSPLATDVHTPPAEALALKRGVCQDFAQVMIACLRSLGLAAKYVSGYLLTQPPPGQMRLIGADASHAWVSVYCPQNGWFEFDPTNNCLAGESHVVVAYGRDYSDVPPLRGVIRGGGAHEMKVSVTVMPEYG